MNTDIDAAAEDDESLDRTEHLSLAEEQLQLRTEPTVIGNVRARRDVQTRDVTFTLVLAQQHVVVDRRRVWPPRPVTGPIAEQSVVVTLDAERPIVDKPAVVAEEVVIRKIPKTDRVDITAKAKHEEPVVDVKGKHPVRGDS